MKEPTNHPIQVHTLLYVLKKHKSKIITVFLLCTLTAIIGSLAATPIYRASSKLLVKAGKEDIYVAPVQGSPHLSDYSSEHKINSEIAILRSENLLKELVNRIGVARLYAESSRNSAGPSPDLRKVYNSIQECLNVSGVGRSNVIEVSFEWPDPAIAAEVVNNLVDLYLVRHTQVHTNPRAYGLLGEQANKWEEKLRKSETELDDFRKRHSITSLAQQKQFLLQKLSALESEHKMTESEIQETEKMIASLKVQLADLSRETQLQESFGQSSSTLVALKAKLIDLELQGLKDEVARIKQMIAEEEKRKQKVVVMGQNPIGQSLEGDLIKARTRLAVLKTKVRNQENQIENYEKRLNTLDGFDQQMHELSRKAEIDEANYKLYLTKFEEAKLLESMDEENIVNVRVIEAAAPNLKPVKPKKRLNVAIGGGFGLLCGIVIVFLIEFIHPVFRSREDVQEFLGLPVLVTLPKESRSQVASTTQQPARIPLLQKAFGALFKLDGKQSSVTEIETASGTVNDQPPAAVRVGPNVFRALFKFFRRETDGREGATNAPADFQVKKMTGRAKERARNYDVKSVAGIDDPSSISDRKESERL